MPEPTQHHRTEDDPALLSAGEVADILGVPPSWVYAEARAGRLPHVRVGRYRRFRRRAVDNCASPARRPA
jgi:excisionase family DNA binding protein